MAGGFICRYRHVMDVADPEQGGDVRLVGLGGQGVPEEDNQIHFLGGNAGADLQVAAKWAGQVAFHIQSGIFPEDSSGGSGCYQVMLGEKGLMLFGKGQHFVFFPVMGN